MHYRLQLKDLDCAFCLGLVLLKLDLQNWKYGKGRTVTNRRLLVLKRLWKMERFPQFSLTQCCCVKGNASLFRARVGILPDYYCTIIF